MFASIKSALFLFIAAFFAGLSFEAGRYILTAVSADGQARAALARSKLTGLVSSPSGLSVESLRVSPGQEGIRFLGVIRNVGEIEWIDPTISMSVTIGKLTIQPCSKLLTLSLRPGEHQSFSIECYGIQGDHLPVDFSYTPTIESAWYERGLKHLCLRWERSHFAD